MFGNKKRIAELELDMHRSTVEAMNYRVRYDMLLGKYNALVERINRAGGEAIFTRQRPQLTKQFDDADLRRLIQLCHPDKHNNSPIAQDMTSKLLKARA